MRRSGSAFAIAAVGTLLSACGGGSPSPAAKVQPPPGPSEANVMRVTVNGALCGAGAYVDEPCVEVTVCTPDQSSCQVVSDILLDTGSYGLRVFSQALSVPLPAVAVTGGALATCVHFGGGAADWGPVRSAAVILGQEPAVQVPIQVIDATFGPPPSACSGAEAGPSVAGFNGILGVGAFVADCGPACASSAANGMYFACGAGGCTGHATATSLQVQNPAALLGADGDGLLVSLPAVPAGGSAAVEGVVVLGIGSRADNQPGGAASLGLDGFGEFQASFLGAGWAAFADTGSNGLFFDPPAGVTTLPGCPAPNGGWFCPASTLHLAGTASEAAGPATIPFAVDVANFDALIAGPNAVFASDGGSGLGGGLLDLGLPFHLGRDVWIGFEGRSSPLGAGPRVGF